MREILVRRRRTRSALLGAALTYAEQWQWPVVPGAGLQTRQAWQSRGARGSIRSFLVSCARGSRRSRESPPPVPRSEELCSCPRPDCVVPGAHPQDPGLLAATCDPRMVRWWWTNRPDAPIVLATGTKVAAVSLPAPAGARALAAFDRVGVPLGPVVASPTRFMLLVQPYSLDELGELLDQQDWVPTSLRYHGSGGYIVLPPSETAGGNLRWERPPAANGVPWLPTIESVVTTLVAASASEPDGSRLAF
ncbi:bifunctional DNA primase/polymerase [Wenjunlia tyrosinilytica]|uniref:DNA primase n=1 Tax=Wenjunlia tyrosinilytica TaxID=1544741 RepID=A0A917ZN27_9ACTN|nr:bifunctional DNA primase/polymerase [Wenjunlia tyrosinilytica]GGO86456.1 DNA primase [Wenjunlia tyrosinilytica]